MKRSRRLPAWGFPVHEEVFECMICLNTRRESERGLVPSEKRGSNSASRQQAQSQHNSQPKDQRTRLSLVSVDKWVLSFNSQSINQLKVRTGVIAKFIAQWNEFFLVILWLSSILNINLIGWSMVQRTVSFTFFNRLVYLLMILKILSSLSSAEKESLLSGLKVVWSWSLPVRQRWNLGLLFQSFAPLIATLIFLFAVQQNENMIFRFAFGSLLLVLTTLSCSSAVRQRFTGSVSSDGMRTARPTNESRASSHSRESFSRTPANGSDTQEPEPKADYCMRCIEQDVLTQKANWPVKYIDRQANWSLGELQVILRHRKYKRDLGLIEENSVTYALQSSGNKSETYVRCPTPDCRVMVLCDRVKVETKMSEDQLRVERSYGLPDSRRFQCNLCKNVSCISCQAAWRVGDISHQYQTCSQHASNTSVKEADRSFEEWRRNRDTQNCPKCSVVIEKNGGCPHMTCRKCRYDFCWFCRRPWSQCLSNCPRR